MNPLNTLEFKVGAFTIITIFLIIVSMFVVDKSPLAEKKTKIFFTLLPDAAGIKKKTQIKTNGITIGEVSGFELKENLVKIYLELDENVILPGDTVINIRTRGLLGDVYIDIARGKDLAKQIEEGGYIPQNAISNDLTSLLNTLSGISRDIKQITSTLRTVFGSEETGTSLKEIIMNLKTLTVNINKGFEDNEASFKNVVNNVADITDSVRLLLVNNEGKINSFIDELSQTSSTFKGIGQTLTKFINEENAETVTQAINKIMLSAQQIDQLLTKVNEGRGSVGRLLNEDKTVNLVNNTLEEVRGFIKPMNDVEILVNYRGEKISGGRSRNHFGLKLNTSPDRGYIVGVIDDSDLKDHTITTFKAENGVESTTSETISDTGDNLRYNFQFAKRWWNTALRFGLFESKGGIAVDQYFFQDQFLLTLETFDYDREELGPVANFWGQIGFLEHLFVTAGLHDIGKSFKNSSNKLNYFGGFGVQFTDDNIKSLLSIGSVAN